jgi:hypothetical protein
MKEVKINCPLCNKSGKIEVDEEILENSQRGIAAINVQESIICAHSFVAYIDKNYNVRDSFVSDFRIDLPNVKIEEKIQKAPQIRFDESSIDLILLDLSAFELASILNGVFSKEKLLLICDNEIISEKLAFMLEYIFQNTFDYEIEIVNRLEYIRYKRDYEGYQIIETDKDLTKKKKEKIIKNIRIESAIIEKFLSEQNSLTGLLILKNEIIKVFEMSKSITEILQNYSGKHKISKKKLFDLLGDKYGIEIQSEYLEFLLEVTKNYHEHNLSGLSDYFFPGLGL